MTALPAFSQVAPERKTASAWIPGTRSPAPSTTTARLPEQGKAGRLS
ncbi:hypothetical protein QP028_09590 [Corynebacterium suedekumii]|nr:hypothetical protein QP028_09590 [Corynebacterium suedekumii]